MSELPVSTVERSRAATVRWLLKICNLATRIDFV